MTDVNYFSPEQKEEKEAKMETPKSNYGGGLIIAGVVALAAWLFLRNRNSTSEIPGASGAGYSESISGGGSDLEAPPFKLPETYFIRDAFTNWWNGLFPASTNDAMLAKLADSRVSTNTKGNAAETLSAVMKLNPESVTTVKLPFVVGGRSAGVVSVSNPGTVVNADGTKVTVNSYDHISTVTGQKYETPKNGFGYVSGPGITAVAGNIQAGIVQNEARLRASAPASTPAGKPAGNAAEAFVLATKNNPGSVATVKLPAAMQAAIDKKTASQGGTAYNALSAAKARRRYN